MCVSVCGGGGGGVDCDGRRNGHGGNEGHRQLRDTSPLKDSIRECLWVMVGVLTSQLRECSRIAAFHVSHFSFIPKLGWGLTTTTEPKPPAEEKKMKTLALSEP